MIGGAISLMKIVNSSADGHSNLTSASSTSTSEKPPPSSRPPSASGVLSLPANSVGANILVRTGTTSADPLFSIAKCNAGEKATGGGGAGGPIVRSAPYISNGHAGDVPAGAGQVPTAWGVTLSSGTATSWVVCASP